MLLTILDIITIIISIYFLAICVKHIFRGDSNMIDYCIIAFFSVQSFPLIMKMILGIADTVMSHINVYRAMNDTLTCILYDFMVIFSIWFLYRLSNRIRKYDAIDNENEIDRSRQPIDLSNTSLSRNLNNFWITIVLSVLMFLPVIIVLFAPRPGIYLKFSYFITQSFNTDGAEYLFHRSVVRVTIYISIAAIWLRYYSKKNSNNLLIYIAIVLNAWIDGKRTMFVFLLLGILVIDLLKGKYNKRSNRQILKTILFALLILGYFIYYSALTGKGTSYVFNHLYTFYFSRMSIVETAIYDKLYTNSMLDFPGQSVLFNVLAWIPRAVWPNKPVMYTFYFTKYAQNTVNFQNFNLMVNIWAEFISNFGFLGPLFASLFLYWVARQSQKSKSRIIYMIGTAFVVIYSVYGFEHIIMRMFYIWLVLVLINKAKKHVRFGSYKL